MANPIPNILFDSRSSQLQVHYQTNTRLTDLYDAIHSQTPPWTYGLSPLPSAPGGKAPPLTPDLLSQYNVLCILTRLDQLAPTLPKSGAYPQGSNLPPYFRIFEQNSFQYTPYEITAIVEFVSKGGGLLLISDHGPPQGNITDNQTINDCQLAAAFGIAIEPAMIVNPHGLIQMSGPCLSDQFSDTIFQGVSNIVVHDCPAIFPFSNDSGFQPLVSLPPNLNNVSPINNVEPTNADGDTLAFALINTQFQGGGGSIIIARNSGIAGNTDHPFPAQGLFYSTPPDPPAQMPYVPNFTSPSLPDAQNKTFLLNCLAYLALPPD